MDWFRFTLGVLGTWRITHLFLIEEGPAGILSRLRKVAATSFLHGLFDCFYCLSLWVAVPFAFLLGYTARDRVLLWLALSGAAILLENVSARLSGGAPAVYFEEGQKNDELLRKEHDDGTGTS